MKRNVTLFAMLLMTGWTVMSAIPKPQVFIKNDGRWPSQVLYAAFTNDATVWITRNGMNVDVVSNTKARPLVHQIRYAICGSKGSGDVLVRHKANEPTVNIFTANQSNTSLQTATEVVVRNVLPNIDIEYVWEKGNVRYNVHAAAGVVPPNQLFRVSGAQDIVVKSNNVVCSTPAGDVEMAEITSFQGSSNEKLNTNVVSGNGTFGFAVANRDVDKALVIDPIVRIVNAKGSGDESIVAIRRRADGNYVIAGTTTSSAMTWSNGAASTNTSGANTDGFVAVLSADMSTVLHWAFIAAQGNDVIRDVAINATGQVYVVGETNSSNFPLGGTSIGQTRGLLTDGFLFVIPPDLSKRIAGMLINGAKADVANGVAINSFGQVVIVGHTDTETGLSTFESFQDTLTGGTDAFVCIIQPTFLGVDKFTYMGGTKNESFKKVVIGDNNTIIACGKTNSEDYYTYPKKIRIPIEDGGGKGGDEDGGGGGTGDAGYEEIGDNAFQYEYGGGASDAIIAKFNIDGILEYSSFFGGTGADEANGLYMDTEGAAFFVGSTTSDNLPIPNSTTAYAGGTDGFVAAITSDGVHLRGASYIGGTGNDVVTGVVQFQPEIGMLTGITNSTDFPNIGPGSLTHVSNNPTGFLARMTVTEIKFASVLGMEGDVAPAAIVKDQNNDAIIGGRLSNGTQAHPVEGAGDAFVAKWAFGVLTYRGPLSADGLCAGKPVRVKWATDGIDATEPHAIDFSDDNGTSWKEIATNLKSREYNYTLPANISSSAQCRFRVRTSRGHEVTTPDAIYVGMLPTISMQPEGATPCPSASVTLSVVVSGEGFTYQWRKDGSNIAGATTADYTLPSVKESDNGSYDVMVANACNSIASNPAVIAVTNAPSVLEQPTSQTVNAGQTVVLKVTVRGWNPTYKWQKNGVDVQTYDANTPELTLQNVTEADAGSYACLIGSDCGTVTSDPAMVSINGVSGVNDEAFASQFTIRPQPATDMVNITVPAMSSIGTIVIHNIHGAEVKRVVVAPSAEQGAIAISTADLPIGRYSVVLTSGEFSTATTITILR